MNQLFLFYGTLYKISIPETIPKHQAANALLLAKNVSLFNWKEKERLLTEQRIPEEWFVEISDVEFIAGWRACKKYYKLGDDSSDPITDNLTKREFP